MYVYLGTTNVETITSSINNPFFINNFTILYIIIIMGGIVLPKLKPNADLN